jgi:hypothetical protein
MRFRKAADRVVGGVGRGRRVAGRVVGAELLADRVLRASKPSVVFHSLAKGSVNVYVRPAGKS